MIQSAMEKKELYDPYPILAMATVNNCNLYQSVEIRGLIYETKIIETYTNGLCCSKDFILRPQNWDLENHVTYPRVVSIVTCRNSSCEFFREPVV